MIFFSLKSFFSPHTGTSAADVDCSGPSPTLLTTPPASQGARYRCSRLPPSPAAPQSPAAPPAPANRPPPGPLPQRRARGQPRRGPQRTAPSRPVPADRSPGPGPTRRGGETARPRRRPASHHGASAAVAQATWHAPAAPMAHFLPAAGRCVPLRHCRKAAPASFTARSW